jgi:hypothetical protein
VHLMSVLLNIINFDLTIALHRSMERQHRNFS